MLVNGEGGNVFSPVNVTFESRIEYLLFCAMVGSDFITLSKAVKSVPLEENIEATDMLVTQVEMCKELFDKEIMKFRYLN